MPKEINPEYSLEGLMLRLKLQYFGHLKRRANSLEKILMLGKIEVRRRNGQQTEDEMVGWHHRLDGHEFKQAPRVDDGQGSLACRSPWGRKESVQFSSVAQLCPTLCDPMDYSTPGFPVHHPSWSLLKLTSIASVMPSNHLILCRPLLLPPSIFPSIRVFSNESVLCIRWPKY